MGGGAPANPGGPRLLQQLFTAVRMSGSPLSGAATCALGQSGFARVQSLMAASVVTDNPSDPFSFVHALLAMDQGQFRQKLALLGAGQGGGL